MKKIRISGDRNLSLMMAIMELGHPGKDLLKKYIEIIPNDGYSLEICESPIDVECDKN